MPEIIRASPTMFTVDCSHCCTQFRYTLSEVIREYSPLQREGIYCPTCSEFCAHRPSRGACRVP